MPSTSHPIVTIDYALDEESRGDVLLLDDDSELKGIIRDFLETAGFAVTAVSDGEQGLRAVQGADFDVIICDVDMPRLPGDQFYLAVQKLKPYLCPRCMFITGETNSPRIANFIVNRKGALLVKPFGLTELGHCVSSICAEFL